jgi:Cu(I)/Ag(I) efflux system membrane protein CusA/SilA
VSGLPIFTVLIAALVFLASFWNPLGFQKTLGINFIFIFLLCSGLLLCFTLFRYFYTSILSWCLNHKLAFLSLPLGLLILGITVWLGFADTFFMLPDSLKETGVCKKAAKIFPGLGKEFMPNLDEGSFLFMPTTMTHASIGEVLDVIKKQDMAIKGIPEVESVVGKLGRAMTPLDPAPVSMIETVINYRPEYGTDSSGKRVRQWRDHIKSPDDIWKEIVKATKILGTTSAPKLQPIAARIVMLQSGMRAPMGVKIKGPSLEKIEDFGLKLEKIIKKVKGVNPDTVIADRIVGKPYLEIIPDRKALARFNIPIERFNTALETAVGGKRTGTLFQGRSRFPIRVRYGRELRDNIEALEKVLVSGTSQMMSMPGTSQKSMSGKSKQVLSGVRHIPLGELAQIRYVRGPQMIKSEDTFLVGYLVFDKMDDQAETDVVERCRKSIERSIASGELHVPDGVSFDFAGSYQNQVRASKTLSLILPAALLIIFMLIYMEFRDTATSMLIFSGVFAAWSGGFILIWLYNQPWFMDFELFSTSMRSVFQIQNINLSVAVWVGFLALFGIATDDGVVMGSYLTGSFKADPPKSVEHIRKSVVKAGNRRVRACLMTTATTILALLPVLTSTGRGSDIMIPMAIPSFGGMLVEVVTMLVVPVLFCWIQEIKFKKNSR